MDDSRLIYLTTNSIAGSETTATVLSGLTYHLLKTPRAFNALKDEARSSFNSYSEINSISTQHLKYLNAVIEEGLRIYPPAPGGFPRVCPGGNVAGHYIPKGVTVSCNIMATARSTRYWENPNEFIPERWLDPRNTDNRAASNPFSLGPRACLGKK